MIYLDHHSTTPLDPRVLDAMLPYLRGEFGNASSTTHDLGRRARAAVERARGQVASLIDAEPEEIVFTSGATEANNLAIRGLAAGRLRGPAGSGRDQLVVPKTEHRSVLDPIERLEREGLVVLAPDVDRHGIVRRAEFEALLGPRTLLVSVMLANNETGVLQPVEALTSAARRVGALVHTDAVQALGRISVRVSALGVDAMSLSAHKVYGPKGVGALWLRDHAEIEPIMFGGGQEHGLRSGTLNVPGIVGFGEAAAIAERVLEEESMRLTRLRDRLWSGLREQVPGVRLNGHPSARLPGNLHVSFAGIDAEALMALVPEVAVSTGAACHAGAGEPSHVLSAMGVEPQVLVSSLRFGLGRTTTEAEVETTIGLFARAARRLRRA